MKRIEEVCKANEVKPKTTDYNIHKDKYTKERISKFGEVNAEMLYFFGYTN